MPNSVVWMGRWICRLHHDILRRLYTQVSPFMKDPGAHTTLKIPGRGFLRKANTYIQSYAVSCPRYPFWSCCLECSRTWWRVLKFKTPISGFQFSFTDLKFCSLLNLKINVT